MRIVGHGIDVVEIARVDALLLRNDDFLYGWFTSREIEALGAKATDSRTLAGRVAAKEAAAKALGTGFAGNVSWQDIEVIATESGAPNIALFGGALTAAMNVGVAALFVSIAHDRSLAIASVIAVQGQPTPSQHI